MTHKRARQVALSLDADDAFLLIDASRDALLRLVHEIHRELGESLSTDRRAAADLAGWADEMAALTRIADEVLTEVARLRAEERNNG